MQFLLQTTLVLAALLGGVAAGHSLYPSLAGPSLPQTKSILPGNGISKVITVIGTIQSYDAASRMLRVTVENPYDGTYEPLPMSIHLGETAKINTSIEIRSAPTEKTDGHTLLYTRAEFIDPASLKPSQRVLVAVARAVGGFEAITVSANE